MAIAGWEGLAMVGKGVGVRPRVSSCVVAAVLMGAIWCGCSSAGPRCYPAQAVVSPRSASAGATVRLSSRGFLACKAHLPRGTRYAIDLYPLSTRQRTPLGVTSVATDGTFSTTVTIPPGTPPGAAMLLLDSDALVALCDADICPEYSSERFAITP